VQTIGKWLLLFCAAVGFDAFPQTSTGRVSGTVRDRSGAVIPGAQVSLTNEGTGVSSVSRTNEEGFYIFPSSIPGNYSLVTESAGMERQQSKFILTVGGSVVIDPVLSPGQTNTLP
jgi:hypothetical protein